MFHPLDPPDTVVPPQAGQAAWVERLLWVFLFSFAFDYRASDPSGRRGHRPTVFSRNLHRLHRGYRRAGLADAHGPSRRMAGRLLGAVHRLHAGERRAAGRAIRPHRSGSSCRWSSAFSGWSTPTSPAAWASALQISSGPYSSSPASTSCGGSSMDLPSGKPRLETVRFEVQSPATNWIAAWIACAVLLRGRFHWSLLVACGVLFIGIVITVSRSLIFPVDRRRDGCRDLLHARREMGAYTHGRAWENACCRSVPPSCSSCWPSAPSPFSNR